MKNQGHTIITNFDMPPIPERHWDWSAYIDPEGPIGRGPTEAAAVADLFCQLDDAP